MKRLILTIFFALGIALSSFGQAFTFTDPGYGHIPSTGPDLTSLAWDLLAWWKLDENTGTNIVDSSTNALADGQVVNGAAWTNNAAFGTALFFDGVNDYVLVTNTDKIAISNNLSICMWIQQTTTGQTSRYGFDKRDGSGDNVAMLYGFLANYYEFYAEGYSGTNPRTPMGSTVTDTARHHIAWTYDGSNLKGYIDGTLTTNRTVSFVLVHSGANSRWRFPTSTGGANFLGCIIDDIRIYRRAITQTEITSLQTNP